MAADDVGTDSQALHDRLTASAAGKSYRWIARATGGHPETVRRYMQGQSPNIEFVTSFCDVFDLNPQWLLTGEGPMRRDEVRSYHLAEADPADLLAAIAATIDRLTDRIDRLELYCQHLETQLRAKSADQADAGSERKRANDTTPERSRSVETKPNAAGTDQSGADAAGPARARRIGRAVSERPHENAD